MTESAVKIVAALWDADLDGLRSGDLRARLHDVGVTRLQLNVDDPDIPDSALRLQVFDQPLSCVVSVWCGEVEKKQEKEESVLDVLRPLAGRLAAWQVEERIPLAPPGQPGGERADALAQVAFLRRPADLSYDDWLAHWHGPHTQIAMETQATFGYVQNRVLAALTDDTPAIDAVVEELFATAALHDIHAFYGSGGSQAELDRRITQLLESCAVMGADHDLDVVPTSRYVWRLEP
jgi:hypothetical protein